MIVRAALRPAFVKIGVVAAALAFVVACAVGGLLYFFTVKFNPAPPGVNYPKPASALEAQRQDLDYFGKLTMLDRAFAPAARAEATRHNFNS